MMWDVVCLDIFMNYLPFVENKDLIIRWNMPKLSKIWQVMPSSTIV